MEYVELRKRTVATVDLNLSDVENRKYCVVPGWFDGESDWMNAESFTGRYEEALMLSPENGDVVPPSWHLVSVLHAGDTHNRARVAEDAFRMNRYKDVPIILVDGTIGFVNKNWNPSSEETAH